MNDQAPYAYDGLDRVFHEKARLGILTSLMAHPKGLAFGDLKQLCDLTDGNLSRHLKALEEAHLITIEKGYRKNRPHTFCQITQSGQKRFLDYLSVLEKVVKNANKLKKEQTKSTNKSTDPHIAGKLLPDA